MYGHVTGKKSGQINEVAIFTRWPYGRVPQLYCNNYSTVVELEIFIVFVNQPFNDFTGYVEKGQLNNRTIYFKNEFS